MRVSNADPELLKLFVRLLRACFAVTNDSVRVTCNLFADHAERYGAIQEYSGFERPEWLG